MKKQKKGFVDAVIGLQWGDEGKGKNIDQLLLTKKYIGVARFNGGANAGHTLKVGNMTFIGHIIPSGCLHKHIHLYIGSGVIVDPVVLIKEIRELQKLGFDVRKRLYISNRAKLVSYLHPFLDRGEEYIRTRTGSKVDTTARGIGPAYSDATARRALLVGDIILPHFREKEINLSLLHTNILDMYREKYGFSVEREKMKEAKREWDTAVRELKKLQISDVSSLIQRELKNGKNILAEGAQAVMLDVNFGDYPNVTSSHTLPGNIALGLGIPTHTLRDLYGVIKAYTTKVGAGNFPAKIKDEALEKALREAGGEFGATTGRPRMCGWLDLFALRYAIGLTGINKIFVNKADICPSDKIKVVTGYKGKDKSKNKILKDFPLYLSEVTDVVTQTLPGWGNKNFAVRTKHKASPELIAYIRYIERSLKDLGVKIISVGTGPERMHSFNWDK